MTEITKPNETSLRLQRTYDAPAEDVFDAWTNPEVLRRWWKANPAWTTPVAEVDLRVGGRYRISMEDPESGKKFTAGGEQEDGELGHASTVAVDFRAEGEQTTVVLEHTGLESLESRDSHGQGWEGVMEAFQAHLNERAAQTS